MRNACRLDGQLLLALAATNLLFVPAESRDSTTGAGTSPERHGAFSSTVGIATPSWEELDGRPLPSWYDEAKFGIFVHWGVFSVPSYGSEWFWVDWKDLTPDKFEPFVNATERPGFTYQEYASRFTAELYRPEYWADSFAKSGAQYVVMTSKHHDGFCTWNSKDVPTTWNWNVMDLGPKRDILGDLAVAVRKQVSAHTNKEIKFGVYHSLYEWYNPLYRIDKANKFATQHFVDTKTMPELYDLVEKYAPEIIWSDGDWEASADYWKARDFLHWYATNSSGAATGVWNDRWGHQTLCKHGGFLTCADRYSPGKLQTRKWENALTIDKNSWGWNRNGTISDYMTVKELVDTLVEVVAYNGNMLLNIGPGPDGTLSPIFVDRLLGIGDWLKVNGVAIYGTRPWDVVQNETESSVFYTKKGVTLYAIFTAWPSKSVLELAYPEPTKDTRAELIGLDSKQNDPSLHWSALDDTSIGRKVSQSKRRRGLEKASGISLQLPALTPDIIPCNHAWVVKITGLANIL